MHPDTSLKVNGHGFERLTRPPQADTVPPNVAAVEVPRCIQHHAVQVDQCPQMVNEEGVLKQKLLESLYEE